MGAYCLGLVDAVPSFGFAGSVSTMTSGAS
jgi:hypothetical protein